MSCTCSLQHVWTCSLLSYFIYSSSTVADLSVKVHFMWLQCSILRRRPNMREISCVCTWYSSPNFFSFTEHCVCSQGNLHVLCMMSFALFGMMTDSKVCCSKYVFFGIQFCMIFCGLLRPQSSIDNMCDNRLFQK